MIRALHFSTALLSATLLLPLTAQSQSTEAGGVKFENTQDLGKSKLVLNGAGVRYKAIFKIYAAGLYLTAKADTPEKVLAMPGPKRIQLVFLRDVDANEFGKLVIRGMEDNALREEFLKSISGTIKLSEVTSVKKRLAAGENISMEYFPGVGTTISINGKVQGDPVKEPEFFSTMLKIWLGKKPADSQLKEALLGKSQERATSNTNN
jgi:Chalcone isomerase-like